MNARNAGDVLTGFGEQLVVRQLKGHLKNEVRTDVLALDETAVHVAVADHGHLHLADQLLVVVRRRGQIVLQSIVQVEGKLEGRDVVAIRLLHETGQMLLVHPDRVRVNFVKYVQDDDSVPPAKEKQVEA